MTLFFACSLAGLGLVLGRFLAVPWCGPFLAVCLTACVELPAAMGGVYHEARLILACLSLAGAAAVLWRQLADWQRGKSCAEEVLPSLLFLWLLCFFAWHYAGARLTYWDEFFWGGFAKHLMQENTLWNWASVLPRRDTVLLYPPMVTLLQSLLQPAGTYSESAIALGEAAVLLSCAGVVMHVARQRLSLLPSSLLVIIAFCLFRTLGASRGDINSYLFAYGDSLQLALYSSLGLALACGKDRRHLVWLLVAGLPVLVLCKASGVLLVLCLWGAWALRSLFAAEQGISRRARLAGTAGIVLPAMAFWLLWRSYLATAIVPGLPPAADPFPVDWQSVRQVVEIYIQAFWERRTIIFPSGERLRFLSHTGVLLAGILCSLGIVFFRQKKIFDSGNWIAVLILLAGFVGWLGAHAYVSICYMHPKEGRWFFSFERYISIALGPLLLISFLCLLEQGEIWGRKIFRSGISAMLIALCIPLTLWGLVPATGVPPYIAAMEQAAGILQKNTPLGSTYWLVTGRQEYIDANVCQYFLMPERREVPVENRFRFNPHGSPEMNLQSGTLPMPLKERVQEQKVDYLLLWNWPDDFLERYGALLGLAKDVRPPVLLRLDAWRQGKVPFPERCPLPSPEAW